MQRDIKALVQRRDGQQQLHSGKMHAHAVSRTGAEGSVHDLHFRGWGFPPAWLEVVGVWKHARVSLRRVRQIADGDAGGHIFTTNQLAWRHPWCRGRDGSS